MASETVPIAIYLIDAESYNPINDGNLGNLAEPAYLMNASEPPILPAHKAQRQGRRYPNEFGYFSLPRS